MFESALVNALVSLADNIELDLRVFGVNTSESTDSLLNVFLIVFEIPVLGSSEYLEMALHMLCKAMSCLPISAQAKLARIWARHCKERLQSLLQALQQLITVKVKQHINLKTIYSDTIIFFLIIFDNEAQAIQLLIFLNSCVKSKSLRVENWRF